MSRKVAILPGLLGLALIFVLPGYARGGEARADSASQSMQIDKGSDVVQVLRQMQRQMQEMQQTILHHMQNIPLQKLTTPVIMTSLNLPVIM